MDTFNLLFLPIGYGLILVLNVVAMCWILICIWCGKCLGQQGRCWI